MRQMGWLTRRPPSAEFAVHSAATDDPEPIASHASSARCAGHAERATLRLEPSAAEIVQAWCRVRSERTGGRSGPRGWVELDVDLDDEADAYFVVLGLGARVSVVAPQALHHRITVEISEMVKQSQEDP